MLVWTSLVAPARQRALLAVGGTMLGALLYVHLGRFYGWTLPWMLGAAPVAALCLRSIVANLWFFARQPFAECDLGLAEAGAPGGTVGAAIRVVARRPVEIRRVSMRLRLERRGPGGKLDELFRSEESLLESKRLREGERAEDATRLPVPDDAPFSFRSLGSEVRIRCLVRVRLESGPPGEPEAPAFPVAEQELEVLIAPGA